MYEQSNREDSFKEENEINIQINSKLDHQEESVENAMGISWSFLGKAALALSTTVVGAFGLSRLLGGFSNAVGNNDSNNNSPSNNTSALQIRSSFENKTTLINNGLVPLNDIDKVKSFPLPNTYSAISNKLGGEKREIQEKREWVGGSEFQVNTYTISNQENPRITALSNGSFVVVWQSYGQDGSADGVYGQLFNANGDKVGPEFPVNTNTTSSQYYPQITALSNGNFVVVWDSYGQDGSGDGVYGQRFDTNGNKAGPEFQVNTFTTFYQLYPVITALSNGNFVVVWISYGQDGSSWDIYGQRFDTNGNKLSGEFQVNTYTTDYQISPAITALSDGSFVVIWKSLGQDGDSYGIYARRFWDNNPTITSSNRTTD